jgi:adenylate kinase
MILLLLGPPGAGKGTQGERLAARLGIPKIATGDVLRAALRAGTPLGLEAKAAMDRGALVPDSVIMGIMQEALAAPDAANGAILDGVVRTTPQAEGLAAMLATLGTPLDAVLLFEACQRPYLGRAPGEPCAECPQTPAGTLVRRRDDEPEAIRTRMQVYRDQTAPVVDWYAAHGARMVPIDALGTLEEVESRVQRGLGLA